MNGAQFPRLVGINYGTFSGWVLKLREAARKQISERSGLISGGLESVPLIEAVPGEAAGAAHSKGEGGGRTSPGALRVDLPGGCRAAAGKSGHLAIDAELVVLAAQAGGTRC